ncbi:MAG: GHMP kinase [Spirochaetota bacterium]|nr:GHMP kinase [Spirochaetota bacterium]
MNTITAYAPGHITGIFYIEDSAVDPLHRGSLGAGFSIQAGVTTRITSSDPSADFSHNQAAADSARSSKPQQAPQFFLNGQPSNDLNVSKLLYDHFTQSVGKTPHRRLKIEHSIEPPPSSGFGTSGAGALSLALALNKYFEFPLSQEEAARLAHVVEIECKTGLGTVIGEYFGGFEIRTTPGAPGIGTVDLLNYPKDLLALFAVRGPSLTSIALSDPKVREGVNRSGRHNLERLRSEPTIPNFLSCSRSFSIGTGLTTRWVESVLELLDKRGIIGSMLMFGEAVFTLVNRRDGAELEALLRDSCIRAEKERVAQVFSAPINSSGGTYL